ncbi:flagellar export protein FliJ [Glaciecola sp. MH2013]|uniref:flagellar export protein FliJ n=1 Tax=Glaciecola sp. MH2013 TaxID=2785524 RepID=UPI00189ED822|nr:flagellar export protein FliJ [Glaciecola sp. MH2013]MBF7072374.1 flagellar export protein FliJ [Glaciecola sp. MH2013]
MSNLKQLMLVLDLESKKENKLAQDYQQAELHKQQSRQKLSGLEQYRLDYLRLIQQKGQLGVEAKELHQHQSFVGKLDKACEQQIQFISQATLVADQRKRLWLDQQKRRKAIEILISSKRAKASVIANRREQDMYDEIALQKYARRKHPGVL